MVFSFSSLQNLTSVKREPFKELKDTGSGGSNRDHLEEKKVTNITAIDSY